MITYLKRIPRLYYFAMLVHICIAISLGFSDKPDLAFAVLLLAAMIFQHALYIIGLEDSNESFNEMKRIADDILKNNDDLLAVNAQLIQHTQDVIDAYTQDNPNAEKIITH